MMICGVQQDMACADMWCTTRSKLEKVFKSPGGPVALTWIL